MTKQDFAINPPCMFCDKPSVTLHEVFYNGKANRNTCIKYNLQAAVCNDCHTKAHDYKFTYQIKWCRKLKIKLNRMNYNKIFLIMGKPEKSWAQIEKYYVIECGNKVIDFYKDYLKK